MGCPRCQQKLPSGARFCPSCGAAAESSPDGELNPTSPGQLQSVLDAIARTAARLCGARDALIFRADGDICRRVARYGTLRTPRAFGEAEPITPYTPHGRAILGQRLIHIRDLRAAARRAFPDSADVQRLTGVRTTLVAPLLAGRSAIGAIVVRRTQVRPFTRAQVSLLRTFADQAAIAIENARLSEELQARNRDLTEALEQQTATADILRVIASSPTSVQPVLETVARAAARFCDAPDVGVLRVDGDVLRGAAFQGPFADAILGRSLGRWDRLTVPSERR